MPRVTHDKSRGELSNALVEGSPPIPRGPARRPRRAGVVLGAVVLATGALAGALAEGAPASERGAGSPATLGVALTVRVQGLSNARGRVAVALFASAKAFPDQKKALAGQLAKIEKGRSVVRFAGVRPGVYAVAVLHDENANSKMDFNFLGMPLEGYGFSNDASAPFGPPSFEKAAFELRPRDSFIPVRMRYFF